MAPNARAWGLQPGVALSPPGPGGASDSAPPATTPRSRRPASVSPASSVETAGHTGISYPGEGQAMGVLQGRRYVVTGKGVNWIGWGGAAPPHGGDTGTMSVKAAREMQYWRGRRARDALKRAPGGGGGLSQPDSVYCPEAGPARARTAAGACIFLFQARENREGGAYRYRQQNIQMAAVSFPRRKRSEHHRDPPFPVAGVAENTNPLNKVKENAGTLIRVTEKC